MGYASISEFLDAKFTCPLTLAFKVKDVSSWGWGRKELGPGHLEEHGKPFKVCDMKQRLFGPFMCNFWGVGAGEKMVILPAKVFAACEKLIHPSPDPQPSHDSYASGGRDSSLRAQGGLCPREAGGSLTARWPSESGPRVHAYVGSLPPPRQVTSATVA